MRDLSSLAGVSSGGLECLWLPGVVNQLRAPGTYIHRVAYLSGILDMCQAALNSLLVSCLLCDIFMSVLRC